MSVVLGIGDTWMLANWNRWHGDATTHDRPWPWYPHVGDPPPPDIGTGHYQPPPIPHGWQCPVCGRVYSPAQMTCLYSDEHAAAYLKIQLELDTLRRMVKEAAE